MNFNFSAIPFQRPLGRIIRWPLRLIPQNTVVPILQGSMVGMKWVVSSSTHGCWLGSYEYEKRRLFEYTVGAGDVVYDIGAHVGFYTLLASGLVGSKGRVVAFEPLSRNLEYLYRHLLLNNINNVVVVESAVMDYDGAAKLLEGSNRSVSSVHPDGTIPVRAVTLDHLVFTEGLERPTVIKIDIEGAEYAALMGAEKILKQCRPTIFLATHNSEVHANCCALLTKMGYGLQPIDGNSLENSSELLGKCE
jgi:FkbM family methyltransferase